MVRLLAEVTEQDTAAGTYRTRNTVSSGLASKVHLALATLLGETAKYDQVAWRTGTGGHRFSSRPFRHGRISW